MYTVYVIFITEHLSVMFHTGTIVKRLLKLTSIFLQTTEKSLKDYIVGCVESFHHNDGFVKYATINRWRNTLPQVFVGHHFMSKRLR